MIASEALRRGGYMSTSRGGLEKIATQRMSYLKDIDYSTLEAGNYDELPLWSAPFGLLLLDRVPLRADITILDVGCGTPDSFSADKNRQAAAEVPLSGKSLPSFSLYRLYPCKFREHQNVGFSLHAPRLWPADKGAAVLLF